MRPRACFGSLRTDLPLILATGFLAGNDDTATHDVFNGAIAKPYDIASLAKVVAAHLPPPR